MHEDLDAARPSTARELRGCYLHHVVPAAACWPKLRHTAPMRARRLVNELLIGGSAFSNGDPAETNFGPLPLKCTTLSGGSIEIEKQAKVS